MKKILFILLLALLLSETALGQAPIKGTVKDMSTAQPLPGVNVYLSGTTFGTSTDSNGQYSFTPPATGSYNLVFSFVGYEKKVRQIELDDSSDLTFNVNLKEKVNKLGNIEVISSNKQEDEQWQNHYSLFFNQFIGKTNFAKDATIENPWVLKFKEQRGKIIATAKRPLTIINNALGYKLYVDLVKFEWPKYHDRGGVYVVYHRYEELKPDRNEQLHQWKKNRIKSYAGSFAHFLKSLYNDKIDENNFTLKRSWNLSRLSTGKTRYELNSKPNIPYAVRETAKGFELKGRIDVKFEGKVKYKFDGAMHSIRIEKRGGIDSTNRDNFFFVDRFGSLINPVSLQTYKEWAASRMANSLPQNYSMGD